jgi:RNA polymerase sigma-70 factor (ECF subfamily)
MDDRQNFLSGDEARRAADATNNLPGRAPCSQTLPSGIQQQMSEKSDEDLMELFQQGTVEAFNIIVERYSDRLYRYLYKFLQDPRRCEDLLQETFLRVHRNRHSYRRIARLSTWLYTIAGNLARSEYRQRARRKTDSLEATTRDGETFERSIPSATLPPDEHVDRGIQRKAIHEALDSLPEYFKEAVVLRDIQELSYEDIADITGLPLGTVKSRINRGRMMLKKRLIEVYPFPVNEGRRRPKAA